MYTIDDRDHVVELADVPRCEAGAPTPIVIADEREVLVAYYLSAEVHRQFTLEAPDAFMEAVGLVRFHAMSHMFGMPNDESLHGHPLQKRGLGPYGAFEVLDSSWIRALERLNSVHDDHSAESFLSLRHIVLTFHDSTFECVASKYAVSIEWGTPTTVVARALADFGATG